MRTIILMLFLGISQPGCSSSYIVSSTPQDEYVSFSNFNAFAKDKSAKIILQDSTTLYAQEVMMQQDSVYILDENTGRRTVMPTLTIKKIVFRNRSLGLLEGTGIGVLAGGATGLLATVVYWSFTTQQKKELWYLVGPIFGGAAGLLVGSIYGVIKGHNYEYEFAGQSKKP